MLRNFKEVLKIKNEVKGLAISTNATVSVKNVIAEKEVAPACLKASVIENLKWIDELGLRGWENGFVYEPVAKKAAENAQTYIKIAYARIADAENEMWNVALENEETATADPVVEEVDEDEDAEIKKLEAEIAELDAEIEVLQKKRKAREIELNRQLGNIVEWAYSEVGKAVGKYDKDFIKIRRANGTMRKVWKKEGGWEELNFEGGEDGRFMAWKNTIKLAE